MENLEKFFDALIDKPAMPYWREFAKQYDEKYRDIIIDINKNGHTYTTDKWNEIYSNNKEIECILLALCKHSDCPDDIINKIIANTEFKYNSYSILHSLLSRENLTPTQIEDICVMKKYEIRKYFPNRTSDEYKMPFSENVTNQLVKDVYLREGKKMDLSFLLYTNDKEFINNVLEENSDFEPFRDTLVNNLFLSDEERNEIFDLGCNRKEVDRPTGYMISNMYRESVEAYFESDYNLATTIAEKRMLQDAHFNGGMFIQRMLQKGFLNDAMQIDLINRFTELKERSQNSILAELLKTTKNEMVFKTAEIGIVSKDKELIFANPNCPKDILYRRTYALIKKIENALKNKKPISDNWVNQIATMLDKIYLSPDYEAVLLSVYGKKLHKNLACSPYTNIETLERIETEASTSRVKMLASVNIALQKAGIHGDTLKLHLFNLGYQLEPATVNAAFGARGSVFYNNENRIMHLVSNFVKSSIKDAETVETELRNIKLKTGDIFPQNAISFYADTIKYLIEKEKAYDGKTLESMHEIEIMDEKDEFLKDIRSYKNSYDVMVNLEEYLNKFNKYDKVLEERKTDLILDKIIKNREVYSTLKENITER